MNESEDRIRGALADYYGTQSFSFDVLDEIPNLYQGWEMDEWCYLVKVKFIFATPAFVLVDSDHGSLRVLNTVAHKRIDLNLYRQTARQLEKALDLIEAQYMEGDTE